MSLVTVTSAMVEQTESTLREAGQQGFELFVLWSGAWRAFNFEVQAVHVPRQRSYRTKAGLYAQVDGDELFRLDRWLYENGQVLGVQVHSHPSNAFHSDTDDTFAMVTRCGDLSIVVPDFCRHGLLSKATAVYTLTERGWVEHEHPVCQVLEVI